MPLCHRCNRRYVSRLSVLMMSAYGILMLIVLVNLLIAIMNDTYDRIKETEEIEVLHNRARLIVDLESLLTKDMRDKLQVGARSTGSRAQGSCTEPWGGRTTTALFKFQPVPQLQPRCLGIIRGAQALISNLPSRAPSSQERLLGDYLHVLVPADKKFNKFMASSESTDGEWKGRMRAFMEAIKRTVDPQLRDIRDKNAAEFKLINSELDYIRKWVVEQKRMMGPLHGGDDEGMHGGHGGGHERAGSSLALGRR